MPQSAFIRPRLKSLLGCKTCRLRRKKCDEQRPQCQACKRLNLQCTWTTSGRKSMPILSQDLQGYNSFQGRRLPVYESEDINLPQASGSRLILAKSDEHAILETPFHFVDFYTYSDRPDWLEDAPRLNTAFAYMWSRGEYIMRHAVPSLQTSNMFQPGLVIAIKFPPLLDAYLAVAARHLSFQHPQLEFFAIRLYSRSIRAVAKRISDGDSSEIICFTAAVFALYEIMNDTEPKTRKTHIMGLQNLINAKLATAPQAWSPTRSILEHYIFSFSINATFYGKELLDGKSLNYIDNLISIRNQGREAFSSTILGVPTSLISIVYKLSFLRIGDTAQNEWQDEVKAQSRLLRSWHKTGIIAASNSEELSLLSNIFRLACLTFVERLECQGLSGADQQSSGHVKAAVNLVNKLYTDRPPLLSLGWPLTILAVASTNTSDREQLKWPLRRLVDESHIHRYETLIRFIDKAWEYQDDRIAPLGTEIFFREDLLRRVHI